MIRAFDYIDANPLQFIGLIIVIALAVWLVKEIRNPWDGDRFPLE